MAVIYDWDSKEYPANIKEEEIIFHSRIVSQHKSTKYYEDKGLQSQARALIPVSELKENAAINCALYNSKKDQDVGLTKDHNPTLDELDEHYFLLLELLNWFKTSFFTWLDKPICPFCHIPTEQNGYDHPSDDDLRWGATRIESYKCPICNLPQRFPRYNHPGKLLTERKGRCGEWANCFTLICRSMDLEARYVLDWTDHVWTEVYSRAHGRWLHCDPCENLCDAPLIYEVGWKKQLSYVIAFSRDQVVDVTWRYSHNHGEVLSRRRLCREGWLIDTLRTLNERLTDRVDDARKKELSVRMVTELVEFLSPKMEIREEELTGRCSGSLEWRLARGETSGEAEGCVVWKPNEEELKKGLLHVVFNSASDKYIRMSSDKDIVKGWRNGVNKCENMFMKVEHDWKMAYLCRTQGSDVGTLTWMFDLSGTPSGVDVVRVKCEGRTYENGEVVWTLSGGQKETFVNVIGSEVFSTSCLRNERTIRLTAELKGGRGTVAWQHAQLFRQPLDALEEYPFEIVITFA